MPSSTDTWLDAARDTGHLVAFRARKNAVRNGHAPALLRADIRELGQVIVGRYHVRRQPQDVTLFKSLGIAIEDVAVAARVYEKARAAGLGKLVEW